MCALEGGRLNIIQCEAVHWRRVALCPSAIAKLAHHHEGRCKHNAVVKP